MNSGMERTKVVIRKLPPSVADADVRELVDSTGANYNWYSFVQGKTSVKRVVHSRCYVNVEDPLVIPAFKAAVEARAFVTERGAQFRGCVEYAPFQKVPQGRPKRDPREGTLDKDPEYLAFVESLSAQPEALPGAQAVGSSGQGTGQESQGPQVTALMAYLQEKHSLKKKAPVLLTRTKGDARPDGRRASKKGTSAKDAPDYSRATPRILTKSRPEPEAEDAIFNKKSSRRISKTAGGAATTAQGASKQQAGGPVSEEAAATTKEKASAAAEEKPVRVRAGFQVYQPKRAGRLSAADEGAGAQLPDSARSGDLASAAKSGTGANSARSAAQAGKDAEAPADDKRASSSSEKGSSRRRRPPKEARQGPKGSPQKPTEPG